MRQLLIERFAFSGGKVDRTGARPVIRDVLLCGPTSANRRRYRKEAFAGDRIKRYEDRPVYLNHGDGRGARRYEDHVATIWKARHRSDGMPIGHLVVKPKHPYAETLLDDAEHNPRVVGMSHVANCEAVRAADGWEDVSEVVSVESVDVVVDPATTKGLFENRNRRGGPMTTIRKMVEKLLRSTRANSANGRCAIALREAVADAEVLDAPTDEMPDDGLGENELADSIRKGFRAAAVALIDRWESGGITAADLRTRFDQLIEKWEHISGDLPDNHPERGEESRRGAAALRESGRLFPAFGAATLRESGSRLFPAIGDTGPRLFPAW